MIEGKGTVERLGREIAEVMLEHVYREQGLEGQIFTSQTPETVTIRVEGVETEFFSVHIVTGRRLVRREGD